jgi:hypothetical protein
MLISMNELAARHGVSATTVQGWRRRGYLVIKNGKVDVDPTEKNLAARPPLGRRDRPKEDESAEDFVLRTVVDEGRAPYSTVEALRIKENALAMLRQIELDTARGEVVRIADITAALAEEYMVLRSGVMSLGARLAPRLIKQSDPNVIKQIIDGEAVALFSELSSRTSQCLNPKSPSEPARD